MLVEVGIRPTLVVGSFTSSHSCFECVQHAFRPHTRVRPVPQRGGVSGGSSRERHCHRFVSSFPVRGHSASISLHPLAPPALPGFSATMDALTPEGWLFVHGSRATADGRAGVTAHEHHPVPFRSPCFMRSNLPTIPSPTTLRRPCAMIWFSDHRAYRRDTLSGVRTDRQRRQLGFATGVEARRDVWPNRVRCLRTGRSPPVALHLTSRPRSYIRLQSSDLTLARTFTLRIRSTYRRTPPRARHVGEGDSWAPAIDRP
jgi:hypothetical protein